MSRTLWAAFCASMVPSVASACTWCSASAFGDRTFNWPYLTLLVAPFAIGAVIIGVLAYYHWAPQLSGSSRPTSAGRADDHHPGSGEVDARGSRPLVRLARSLDKETT